MREIGDWFGLRSVAEGADVVVLGCPFDGAASGRRGARAAPAALRAWSRSAEAVSESGRRLGPLGVADGGDVAASGDWYAATVAAAAEALARSPEAFFLGLGGDHAITQPLLRALGARNDRLGLLLLDAHADVFPDYEGDRRSHACTVARAWDECGISPRATALVGLRSFALPELQELQRAGLVLDAGTWHREGSAATADRIARVLSGRPVYVSLDIDVLDPSCAPGTGYPVAGGPSTRALLDLLEHLWPQIDVVALDLVEVSPELDASEITVSGAAHLLLQILGHVDRSRA